MNNNEKQGKRVGGNVINDVCQWFSRRYFLGENFRRCVSRAYWRMVALKSRKSGVDLKETFTALTKRVAIVCRATCVGDFGF